MEANSKFTGDFYKYDAQGIIKDTFYEVPDSNDLDYFNQSDDNEYELSGTLPFVLISNKLKFEVLYNSILKLSYNKRVPK